MAFYVNFTRGNSSILIVRRRVEQLTLNIRDSENWAWFLKQSPADDQIEVPSNCYFDFSFIYFWLNP